MPDPLAFLLTWNTYGTWLPGDERGWVKYKQGRQAPDPIVKLEAEARMTEDACVLDDEQRMLVETTVADHCRIRGWTMLAVNCRTNHVHVVVAARHRDPDEVREQLKAWCTRRLKELDAQRGMGRPGSGEPRTQWWAERGSVRCLNDDESVEAAVRYVLEGQDLPREKTNPAAEEGDTNPTRKRGEDKPGDAPARRA
ncbi:MAG: hypothetical protein WD278_00025 [Pirellulales bacterium]